MEATAAKPPTSHVDFQPIRVEFLIGVTRSHQDHLIRNLPRKDQKTQPATGQLHNLNNPSPVISSLVSTNVCRMVCLETP